MSERTVGKANRIVVEKETKDLGKMLDYAKKIQEDEKLSQIYRDGTAQIIEDEVKRINPPGPPPEDE